MRISVVVPTYNGAWCIARTLKSVQSQTFKDFEVIVVDDGSSDDTVDVVRRTVGDDPRFRLYEQSNVGVAATRNRALRLAQGEYIAPLDHDDLWRETFLQEAVAALDGNRGAVMAFARSVWIDAEDRAPPQAPIHVPQPVDYRQLLRRNPIGNGSCTMVRAEALKEIGFDVELTRRFGQADDWWTQLQLSWRGEIAFIDAPLVAYRISAGATSHQQIWRMTRASLEIIRRARRLGPRLRLRDYLDARSLLLIWQMRRARGAGQLGLAFLLAFLAYAGHPLWFLEPDLRALVRRVLTAPFRICRRDIWRDLLRASPATPRA
jgi:glycosyltransferase involved in cell wall biosynthesis